MTQPGTQLASMGGDTAADNETDGGGRTVAPQPYALSDAPGPLDREELRLLDAWWRAANYLAVGQIYLMANPLLREPLAAEHVKPRLLGHFGTVPGLNLLGGCVAALGGLDALVFTGGVGEHAAQVRALVAERLSWLGVAIGAAAAGEEVTAAGARVRTFVVHAREDLQMRGEATAVLAAHDEDGLASCQETLPAAK